MRSSETSSLEEPFVARYRRIIETEAYRDRSAAPPEAAALRARLETSHRALEAAQASTLTLLTTVRSLFARTVESGGTIDTIADHFDARIMVLARLQQDPAGSHDLEMLIRDALREFQFGDDARITITGRIAWLQPSQAQPLALALHELVTNALKFGALSRDEGRLDIRWVVTAGELRIDWRESGIAADPTSALHHGVGRGLIEQSLPEMLDARTRFVLHPDGLECHIAFPIVANYDVARHIRACRLPERGILQ